MTPPPPRSRAQADERKAKSEDRLLLNAYVNAIGDLSFKSLFAARVSDMAARVERGLDQTLQQQKGRGLSAALAAAQKLRKAAGRLTVQDLFLADERQHGAALRAARALHKAGIAVPLMTPKPTARERYFATVVLRRMLRVLGNYTPRDLFQKPYTELSELERSVMLEAKMVACVPGCPRLPPNGKAAFIDPDSGICRCRPMPDANCVDTSSGGCAAGSDPGEPQPPEMEPSPGAGGNP